MLADIVLSICYAIMVYYVTLSSNLPFLLVHEMCSPNYACIANEFLNVRPGNLICGRSFYALWLLVSDMFLNLILNLVQFILLLHLGGEFEIKTLHMTLIMLF